MKNTLQKIIDCGLLATLILFPFSINSALISPDDIAHPIIAITFSLADMLIGLLLMLWLFKLLFYREWREVKFPPTTIMVFIGVVLISFVKAISISDWAKESVQMIEYFVLFYLLLVNNFKSVKRRTIFFTFYITTSILLLLAFTQHTILDADVYLVRGLFENRNFLGAYLCLAIPLVYTEFVHSGKMPLKIWMAILLVLSVWVLVSGSAIIALVLSLGIISWEFGKKIFMRYAIFILMLTIIYPFVFPEKNVASLKEFLSIYEQGSISKNYYRRLTMLGDKNKRILFQKNIENNYILVTTDQYFKSSLPEPENGERYKDFEKKKHIKNRYLEMQAAINLISEHSLLGVGAGNYQENIGSYFKELPKVNTAEPGQNNGYLVIGTTLGIIGLVSFIWLFLSIPVGIICLNLKETFQIALLGSVIAGLFENFFVYLFTINLMVPVVFIFYLLYNNQVKDNSDLHSASAE